MGKQDGVYERHSLLSIYQSIIHHTFITDKKARTKDKNLINRIWNKILI